MNESVFRDLQNPYYCLWKKYLAETDYLNFSSIKAEEYQLCKLNDIIATAKTLNPYKNYEKIKTLKDFESFPFLEKEQLIENINDYSLNKEEYITTGGSSGLSLGFYRTKRAFAKELATKAFLYGRIGWKEGDKQIVFRGLPIKNKRKIEYVKDLEELRCSSYYMNEEYIDFYIKKAFEYKPDFLKCYPSSGFFLARYIRDNKKVFPKIKGILCASENLYKEQENLMKEVFDTKVFSHYGHYELSVIASYCEYESVYHVLPQYGYAELIDKSGKKITKIGEIGEIVGTSFINDGTIFIRYKTKDFAELKGFKCESCKRENQIWSKIEGRRQDFIKTKTGRLISGTAINMHDNTFDSFKQYQFLQEKEGVVTLLYIPKKDVIDFSFIKKKILEKFDNDIDIIFKEVDYIEITKKRGKFLFINQKLQL